jgi:hypothetical protein
MGPVEIVMVGEFRDEVAEVPFTEDDEVMHALLTDGADPTLGVAIHQWTARADFHDFDVLRRKGGVEFGAELAIEIANQVSRFDRLLCGMPTEVLALLGDPGLGWVGGHAGDINATALDVDEKEHEAIDGAAHGDDLLREEVAGPKGRGLAFDKIVPGALAALWRGFEPSALRMLRTVSRQMLANPSLSSSPRMPLCPQVGFSRARRMTSERRSSAIRGRPILAGAVPWFSWRTQRKKVSGETMVSNWRMASPRGLPKRSRRRRS